MASLNTLILEIANPHQQESLRKLLLRDESYQMYLAGYEKNLSDEWGHDHVQGTFRVLGTLNKRGERSEYTIKLYKPRPSTRASFWCSCPEHKFQSNKKQIFCKHICFLLCRVARVYNAELFTTKLFTEEMFARFVAAVENNANLMQDHAICRASASTTGLFTTITKAPEEGDSCPICFDDITVEHINVSCPDCHNNIHSECMEIWLGTGKITCVYCRSDVWRRYRGHRLN
jgi:hypothetical protein